MEGYHEAAGLTSGTNPYAYQVIPPVGELLNIICEDRSVGGCFRPGIRWLATEMGYKSASQIPYLLSQLACDGWISYDATTGVIMLLRDPREPDSDRSIRSIDHRSAEEITDDDSDDSAVIDPIGRDLALSDAECETDQSGRSIPQRMEDSCSAAADHDSESAAARYKYHAAQKPISPTDHPAALIMAELGTNATLRARALESRPDLTPQQVRDTWSHFEPRIAAKRCTAAAFHAAIANGEIHAAPPDPNRPLDPADYADDPGVMLGSQAPPGETEPESTRDHAARLLPKPTAATIRDHTRDWMFLQCRLGAGDSDEAALAALESHRKQVRR